jgi:hypothetical protein
VSSEGTPREQVVKLALGLQSLGPHGLDARARHTWGDPAVRTGETIQLRAGVEVEATTRVKPSVAT